MHVLLIDDDSRLFDLLQTYLGDNAISLDNANDGPRGLALLAQGAYDAVLLDVMMPGMSGLEVCRRIRQTSQVPIVMLTAKGDETDRVVGLEIGADDYLPKPFSPRELLARLRAVTRRAQNAGSEKLAVRDITVDVGGHEVRVKGKRIELTGLEFDLLLTLMRRAGRVVPREALMRDGTIVGDRTVDVHISHLRQKLGDPASIKTVRGVGYLLVRDGE